MVSPFSFSLGFRFIQNSNCPRRICALRLGHRPHLSTLTTDFYISDLDSLCSALLFAYLRTHAHAPPRLHIPLCNLQRGDLALRPEFGAVLHDAALTTDDVLTLDELPGPRDLAPADTRWLLVDHNVLTGPLAQVYGSKGSGSQNLVIGCVDHHDDEGEVPHDAEPRVIEKCGSCVSLIVEECAATWDRLTSEEAEAEGEKGGATLDARTRAHLARLVLAPALIDTRSLTDATKTTARDHRAVEYAEAKLASPGTDDSDATASDGPYARARFFEHMSALRSDIAGLSIRDVLRKDYKEWSEGEGDGTIKLGTSSVTRPIAYLVEKAGGEEALVESLRAWGEERAVDLVVVMTSARIDGAHGRELLVWARTGKRAADAARAFADAFAEPLELRPWGDGGGLNADADAVAAAGDGGCGTEGWMRCWAQGKLECSRKQVAPMLREAMRRSLNA